MTTETPVVHADPSSRLTAAYREIHLRRMMGLPFLNDALDVEAVAFAPWNGSWLGVMVTPWFINLMLVPREPDAWKPLAFGDKRTYRFPAGPYEFIGGDDALIGPYQSCSLFSPVPEFEDHATAVMVAALAREALFDASHAEVPEYPQGDLTPKDAGPGPLARLEAELDAPLSKRDFLRGRFLPSGDDDRR